MKESFSGKAPEKLTIYKKQNPKGLRPLGFLLIYL